MPFEMLVGLQVGDDAIYAQYSEAMAPILARYGGGFRYDFTIAQVLKSETSEPINRLFTLYFADQNSRDEFFAARDYLAVKAQFFEKSVTATTFLAEYNR